jgi:hypothetical protein
LKWAPSGRIAAIRRTSTRRRQRRASRGRSLAWSWALILVGVAVIGTFLSGCVRLAWSAGRPCRGQAGDPHRRGFLIGRERGGAWRRPASGSKIRRSRRPARQHVMRRAARLKTRVGCMDRRRRATHNTDSSAQESSYLRASDPAPPARQALSGPQLDDPRMTYASRSTGAVNRREHRRAEHTDGESEWEKALAGEIHTAAVFRSGWNVECCCIQSFVPACEADVMSDEEFCTEGCPHSRDARHRGASRYGAPPAPPWAARDADRRTVNERRK